MRYIAIIDYDHLDHSLFMKAFSEAMARQSGCSGIILHGDSAYTERLIQIGTMREDAVIRSSRDLNHRIVALLADSGVSGIGINGYQKNIIQKKGDTLLADDKWMEERPAGTHLVLSNLVWDIEKHRVVSFPLRTMAEALFKQLNRDAIIIFSANDSDESLFMGKINENQPGNIEGPEMQHNIPGDLNPPPKNSFLSSIKAFGDLPDTSGMHQFHSE